MPGLIRKDYQLTPETIQTDLTWASLVSLRLSQFDELGGKQALAQQLKEAIHNVGFFYLTDFGLTEAEVDEQFVEAAEIFEEPMEEKMKVRVNQELPGGPLGYKPPGLYSLGKTGVKDTIEIYDDPKYNSHFAGRLRPATCQRLAAQNEKFCRHLHEHVLYRLLVLTAIILELDDEETLWRMHNYNGMSNCHMRYMVHWPRTEAVKGTQTNIAGHTDFGTFTLLFRQPVAGLQVRMDDDDSQWKWVKPAKHSITVNVADTLSFLTGGYLKSSIHRVALPPPDQASAPRLSVIYFSRPDDDTVLNAVDSPLIKRVGNTADMPPGGAGTAGQWVAARYGNIHRTMDPAAKDQMLNGVKVKTYN